MRPHRYYIDYELTRKISRIILNRAIKYDRDKTAARVKVNGVRPWSDPKVREEIRNYAFAKLHLALKGYVWHSPTSEFFSELCALVINPRSTDGFFYRTNFLDGAVQGLWEMFFYETVLSPHNGHLDYM
jgi:hypothetical protein